MSHSKTLIAAAALALCASAPAHALTVVYAATLAGASEATPNASPGTGTASVTVDFDAKTMNVETTFAGLLAPNTAAHIHCCTDVPDTGTAGVATTTPTFTGFPAGVTSGTYSHLFDMTLASSYNPAFITAHGGTTDGAFSFLTAGMDAGEAYLNIHSSLFPSGEIRGFLHAVPEPDTYALMLLGLGAVAWMRARRRVG